MKLSLRVLSVGIAAISAAAILAPGSSGHAAQANPAPGKPMKMDDPMPIKMAKPGMKKGDVKKAAEKKQREMAPMIEKESAHKTKL